MYFCDETNITCKAGNGGNGAVLFRREKFVPRGGPDGGPGGDGGSIILRANEHISTLINLNSKKQFTADDGEKGSSKRSRGMDGVNLILEVPVGTIIKDENNICIADLRHHNDEFIVARGGMGGKGNSQFATSIRQCPNFAELGEPGETKNVTLELRLVADVGIIGLPSAGKSTLISVISSAKPKIADYPFTTLVPNLGVVDMQQFGGDIGTGFTVVDIPGLIEGASEGKGLGHEFLKHVGRAKILVHLIDGTLDDIYMNFKVIVSELKKYSKELAEKKQIIVINKDDLLIPEIRNEIISEFKKHKHATPFFISALTKSGIKELSFEVLKLLTKERSLIKTPRITKEEEPKIFRPHLDDANHVEVKLLGSETITMTKEEGANRLTHYGRTKKRELHDKLKEDEITEAEYDRELYILKNGFKPEEKTTNVKRSMYEVSGKRINQIAIMTDTSNVEAVERMHDILEKQNIYSKLKSAGAKKGDIIRINTRTFIFRGK